MYNVYQKEQKLSKKRGNGEGFHPSPQEWRVVCPVFHRFTRPRGRKRKTVYGKTRAEVATKFLQGARDGKVASSSIPGMRL